MNILLVDDEAPAIDGTLAAVEWKQLGVNETFTAFSKAEAQEIFNTEQVDIMICDIEMPQGSGIELLTWVREHHPETEAIFLTAHADFKYAQQAIQLGCVDYVLKPIQSDELEDVLNVAISQINQRKKSLQYRQYGKFWLQNKPLVIERFWLDVLKGGILPNLEAIRSAAKELSIHLHDESLVLPIMVKVQRWYKDLSIKEENKFQTELCDVTEDFIEAIINEASVFPVEQGILVGISEVSNAELDMTSLKLKLESLIVHCNQRFFCDISIYVGEPALIVDLGARMDHLKTMDQNNVSYSNRVFLPERKIYPSINVDLPDFNVWLKMMAEGLKDSLHDEVDRYQQFLQTQSGADAQFLIQFHQDFLQMVYVVLQEKGIQAHQLFNDTRSQELSMKAIRMVTDLFTWVHYVIDKACDYIKDVELSYSIMDKVKQYVSQNIHEKLTREEIANFVYLHPDYLTRIVKKETGMPIIQYIQQQRVALAKELLIKTDMPVSEIAMQVGYMHFSQFSKIFKRHIDMTPIQFRHMQKGDNQYQ